MRTSADVRTSEISLGAMGNDAPGDSRKSGSQSNRGSLAPPFQEQVDDPNPGVIRGSVAPKKASVQVGEDSLAHFAMAAQAQAGGGGDVVARPQGLTFNEAVMTMIVNCVGAGVVLFPKIMTDVGMLIAPLLCTICAFTCLECGVMLTSAAEMAEKYLGTPIKTYEELAEFSAPKGRIGLLITKNAAFLGFVIAYMQLVIDSVATFFAKPEDVKFILRFAVVMPLFCVLAMIRDLKQLAKFGTLGICMVIVECGCIMGGGVTLMFTEDDIKYNPLPAVDGSELPGACGKYIAIFLFSFAILGTVPTVRAQLENPSEMHGVLSRSFIMLIFINCAVMTCGYLGYGSKAGDNVIVDMAGKGGWYTYAGYAGSISVVVNVLLSTPLYLFCVMSVIEASGTGAIFTQLSPANMGLRVTLVVTLGSIGYMLPYVGEVIGLVSSVFACCNNILFPAMFHYFARKKVDTVAKHATLRQVKYIGSLLVGLCVLIFGFQGSLETLLSKLAAGAAQAKCEEDKAATWDIDAAACKTANTTVAAATDAAVDVVMATVAAIVG